METLKKLVIAALLAALLLLSGYLLGRRAGRASVTAEIVRTDTLRIRDTLLVERPVPVEVRVVDTMLVAVNDTVYLQLPREEKVYESGDYRAQVSGYRPELDWIEVYPQTVYVTRNISEDSRKRWGIGVQAGYGAYFDGGDVSLSPYVGIGISWNILTW